MLKFNDKIIKLFLKKVNKFLGNKLMNFLAVLCVVLKNLIYGSAILFTKHLTENVDVADILALRFLISFVFIWLLKTLKLLKINIGVRDIFIKNERTPYIKSIAAAVIFEPVLCLSFETLGISMTNGITTAVIVALYPMVVCLTEITVLKEKTTFAEKVLLAVGILGVVYISVKSGAEGGKNSVIGILLLFLSVFSGALYQALTRKSTKHFSSMEISYLYALSGAAAFNLFNVIRHIAEGTLFSYFAPLTDLNNLTGFLFLSVMGSIVAITMANYAFSKMQITTVAAFGGISTLTTIVLGVVFRNESVYYYHIIGLTLVFIRLFGVYYIAKKREKTSASDISS